MRSVFASIIGQFIPSTIIAPPAFRSQSRAAFVSLLLDLSQCTLVSASRNYRGSVRRESWIKLEE